MVCSMEPKIDFPLVSKISIFTLSPSCKNGVDGLPVLIVSIVRFSANQLNPRVSSELEIVPEPIIEPAFKGRVVAACATNLAKLNCISTPQFGFPNHSSFIQVRIGRCTLKFCHWSPNSSRVANTGANAVGGFPCTKPNPFFNSGGIIALKETSLIILIKMIQKLRQIWSRMGSKTDAENEVVFR